jgi:hypothetical protein
VSPVCLERMRLSASFLSVSCASASAASVHLNRRSDVGMPVLGDAWKCRFGKRYDEWVCFPHEWPKRRLLCKR